MLGYPPLLVVCDFDRYEVHTNFNNTIKRIYRFSKANIQFDNSVANSTFTPIQILRNQNRPVGYLAEDDLNWGLLIN